MKIAIKALNYRKILAKQFDNISRFLTSFDTTSWAKFLGIKTDYAVLSNADLSTVTSQADAILLLGKNKKKAGARRGSGVLRPDDRHSHRALLCIGL